jgi:hypothetical protein
MTHNTTTYHANGEIMVTGANDVATTVRASVPDADAKSVYDRFSMSCAWYWTRWSRCAGPSRAC